MLRIGIVGCGFRGSELARFVVNQLSREARLVTICDSDEKKAYALAAQLDPHPDVLPVESVPLHCDLVIEAATQECCRDLVPKALDLGRDIMVMSAGGLIDHYEEWSDRARDRNSRIYVPSGAIAGIDCLEAAMLSNVSSVALTARQPPAAFVGTPYVQERNVDLSRIDQAVLLYEGTAREALKLFPQNFNVAATLGMAGIGFDQTKVTVIADPAIAFNVHELEVVGDFGRMHTRVENLPAPQNPQASYLALMSACATLLEILKPLKIGT